MSEGSRTTPTPACGTGRLAPTEPQPIRLDYKGIAGDEIHYQRAAGKGIKGYDVYIKVDGKGTSWRLQEEPRKFQGKPVGRNRFGPFPICKPQTIDPDHLLEKQCDEGDCLFLYLAREGVTLTLGVQQDQPPTGPCSFNPLRRPSVVHLYFHDPVCEASTVPPDKRPSAKP